MNSTLRSLSLALCLLAVNAPAQVSSQATGAVSPTPPAKVPREITFPAVTYACISLAIPIEDDEAKDVIENARARWFDVARAVGLKRAGNVFIHARLSAAGTPSSSALPAEACGIVDEGTPLQGMQIHQIPKRSGFAGFCNGKLEVPACLAEAASQAGFTDTIPWPWLPMYARWSESEPAPAVDADIVRYLMTASINIPASVPGQGKAFEQSTGGLVPLVPCNNCSAAGVALRVVPTGRGIAWFIPIRIVVDTPEKPQQSAGESK